MSNNSTHPVKITNLVNDFLVIQLHDDNLKEAQIQYQIINEVKKTIRKGCFIGSMVQLRVSHLQEGEYVIHVCVGESEQFDYSFTKLSPDHTATVPYYYDPQSA